MAENIIVGATVKVDTAAASANVKGLNKDLKDVNTSLKQTGSGATAVSKDINTAGTSFSNIRSQISTLPGPVGKATSSVSGLGSTFTALRANPVGLVITAIVGAVTLLYKAFTNTYEGGQKVEQIFAGIKAVGQALLDNLLKVAGAIVKVFSFDFSGAVQDMQEVQDAVVNAYTAMSELTKQAQQLKREQLANDLDSAERQKRLAILREQATDDTVPLEKRKALLKELQADAQKNAQEDIDLARRTAENKIAMLTLEKDGEKKNAEEITKIKIEQINVETENANELRRINKQVTAAEKEEQQARKEAQQKAAEAAKENRQKLIEFNNKLLKLQQENDLALVKDGYEKELQALEFKFLNEKRALEQDYADKKITKAQLARLEQEQDLQLQLQKKKLADKNNEELAKKEADFQKELIQLSNKIKVDGITDQRQAEKVTLNISYEERLQDAITRYKDDQEKFAQVKALLDEQLRIDQDKLDAKNQKEDAKKKYEQEIEAQKEIIDARNTDFEAKRAAIDAEVLLAKQAFDSRTLSEQEYNNKVKEMTAARMQIAELEANHKKDQVNEVATALVSLGTIVGKQTAIGKGLGIATALINTWQGASEALKQKSTLPSPFDVIAKIANVTAVVAAGLKTVREITKVNVPGGGGGGGSVGSAPSITAPAPVAPVQASTRIDQVSIDGINNNQRSIRAHVVEEDNQQAAARARRLQAQSVLGGG